MTSASHDRDPFADTRSVLEARARELREAVRAAQLRRDAEQYGRIVDDVHDLEAESFADLVVDVGLAEIDRELAELRTIEAALRRVADGSYGLCEQCAREIDPRRLDAAPAATRCVDCQSLHERTHFQRVGHTL